MPLKKIRHSKESFSERFFAQYSFLASDNFFLYSGVSHKARFAINSGEFMVCFKRSFLCAKATGSDIFSALLDCAARIPSILRFFISGSLFNILWYPLIGCNGSNSFFRFASIISGRGDATPSPPSVKFTSVPPFIFRLKWAIKEHSSDCASSQESFVKRCTRTLPDPYLSTKENAKGFLSLFLIRRGFHRVGVFPMPT